MPGEIIVPLSVYNSVGFHQLNVTAAYVVRSVDVEAVRAAANRVVEKWRLLAGRLEKNAADRYQIRVPLGKLDEHQKRASFTFAKLSTSLDVPLPRLHSDTALLMDRPALRFFRHSSTPHDIQSYIAKKLPIFSIHISQLTSYYCVGVTFPHALFDGVGMAMILHALSAEMNRQEWTPPPLRTTNIADATLDAIRVQNPPIPAETEKRIISDLERDLAPVGVSSVAAIGRNLAYERVWQRSEHHSIYFGGSACKKLVRQCRQDLLVLGVKDVHLAITDILLAWFIKNSYNGDTASDLPIVLNSATNFRQYLLSMEPGFSQYPHNLLFLIPQLNVTVRQLQKMSVAEVALSIRTATESHRGLSYIQIAHKFTASKGGSLVPKRSTDVDAWIHTNQTIARSDLFSWGSEVLGIWHFMCPMTPEKGMSLHKFKDGIMLDGRIRKSHWHSLQRELQRLNKEWKLGSAFEEARL